MSRLSSILRWVALIGTLGSIATLEYLAGQAAGWSTWRAIGVPIGVDAFVMSVLLADRARWFDRAAALGLMEATVVISAVAGHHDKVDGQDPNVALGAILATALVFALWRVDETFRSERQYADEAAATRTELDKAKADLAGAEGRMRRAVGEAVAATVAEQEALRERAVRGAAVAATAKQEHRRRETPSEPTATDEELAEVIADVLQTNPKAGRNTVTAALKERGLTPGKTERLTDALAARKRRAMHVATG